MATVNPETMTKSNPERPQDELPPMVSTRARIWRRFTKHKMAVAGMWILGLMYLLMIFAEFFAPYTEAYEDRTKSYQPPSAIHVMHEGKFIGPFIYDQVEEFNPETLLSQYREDASTPYRIRLFHQGVPYKLWGLIPGDLHFFGVEGDKARLYLIGSDQAGRDILSRLFYGARVSLTVGIMAIAIVIPLGMLIGGIAGYFGGWIDNVLMRIVEALMAFPSFYLLLALFGVTYHWDITPTQRYFVITGILALLGWTSLSRVIRGMVLSLKQQEYVEASRAAGASHLWVIVKHILPQTASWVIVSISLMVPSYILGESALSMLGLGVQQPAASWGNMLEEARSLASLSLHPWLLAPGFVIVATVVAFNFFGDGLRDAFDSKKRV